MYICYVDESGHCGKKFNPDQPVEVLFGVMLNLTKLTKAQRQHNIFINIFNDHGLEVSEFKACDIYGGRNQFEDFPYQVRDELFSLLLNWGEDRKCKYFLSPIDSRMHFDLIKQKNEIAEKLKYPFEAGALNISLAVHRSQKSQKNNKGRTFLIFDEQRVHDEGFLKIFERDLSFTDAYTKYDEKEGERLNQIIDVPLFSKSHLATIIQLADLGAFISRRYIELHPYGMDERYDNERGKIKNWYIRLLRRKVTHSSINPNDDDPLCEYYRKIRPGGWSAKEWLVNNA